MTKHQLPPLPYDYNALEPHIDEQTMRIHHDKHHQAYIDKLNAALEKHPNLQGKEVQELLRDLNRIPEDIRAVVRNHGGGHYNHSLFWPMLAKGDPNPSGDLLDAIHANFGSFERFKEAFSQAAVGQFGSGWAWLVLNESGSLQVVSTPNQDNPISQGLTPILGIDVWEHAYYLKYQNKRPEYIENFWKVVNWAQVERNYKDAMER